MQAIVGGGLAVILGLIGYTGYQRMYVRPRDNLNERMRSVQSASEAREAATDEIPVLRKRLRELAAGTLGSDEETVAASLRTSLNEIVGHYGLGSPSVSTRRSEPIRNPAAMKATDLGDRTARNRPDFQAMSASLRAVGGLESLLRVLATLEQQPWVHRVDGWTITPVDKSREKFEFTVELTTMYLPEPDLRAATVGPGLKLWEPVDETQFAMHRGILARAAFRAPPPDAPAPPPVKVAGPPPPIAPPYEEWKVTGVVKGRGGWELWVRNAKSGQAMTLFPGDRVLDARFLEATGETATLEIGGTRFVVALGQSLGDRRPASQ